MTPTLADFVVQELDAAGTEIAFGVPGSFVMPVWQRFNSSPRIVLARHETGAVYMADGWSRATGRMGAVVVTIGPGMVNAISGVASAFRDSIAMLVITGQAPTATFGRGAFLESYVLDRSVAPDRLFGPITKASLEIVDLANAPFLVSTAIRLARSGRPGPVHVSLPVDLQTAQITGPLPDHRPPLHAETEFAAPHGVTRAAELVSAARRPLVVAGWGVVLANAADAVEAFATRAGALVVSSTKARACFAAPDEWYLGHLGPGERPDLEDRLHEYDPDLIVVAGASLANYYSRPLMPLLAGAPSVRIDVDPDQLGLRFQPTLAISADARQVLEALAALVLGKEGPGAPVELCADHRRVGRQALAAQPSTYDGLVSMSGAIARLARLLPDDAVVVPDAGNHWLDVLALHQPVRRGGIQLNCGLGGMGWALGASVGMAFSRRWRRVVCVTGDASALMHGAEMSVAAEHGLDVLFVLFNNRSHGRVRLGQLQELDGRVVATDIPEIGFAEWMTAMGVSAERAEDIAHFESLVADACETPGPRGIEIVCHPDEVPAPLRNWIQVAK